MAKIIVKLRFESEAAVGPGKIRLLELIAETGSIAAAARAMKMSYRRAWLLVTDLNATFEAALVVSRPGGVDGGGATLTARGHEVIRRYRAIEVQTARAAQRHLAALERMIATLE